MRVVQRLRHWSFGKLGSFGTFVLLSPCLLYILIMRKFLIQSLLTVVQGHAGHNSLHLPLIVITASMVVALPYITCVRWLSNRRKSGTHDIFCGIVLLLCFCLVSVLVWPLYGLVTYIWSMGFTPKRIAGLVYAVNAVICMSSFAWWAVLLPGSPTRREEAGTTEYFRPRDSDAFDEMMQRTAENVARLAKPLYLELIMFISGLVMVLTGMLFDPRAARVVIEVIGMMFGYQM